MPQGLSWAEEIRAWQKQSQQMRLTFDRVSMMDEIVEAIDWTLEQITDDIPEEGQWFFVYGTSRDDLIKMRAELLQARTRPFLH